VVPFCVRVSNEFARLVRKHDAEKASKGFGSWDQFVGMMFCQVARADSLREIEHGLAAAQGKLTHLGMKSAPPRSTLSYANNHRPAELYEDLFYDLLDLLSSQGMYLRKKKFRFKNKLLSLDATVISLCAKLFPWAKFRQTKGAVKLNVMLDHDLYMPVFLDLTVGSKHEVTAARDIPIPPESIVAMDMGYTDYSLYEAWTRRSIWFVTRLKENATYEVVESRDVPLNAPILSDEVIRLTGVKAPSDLLLRRVVVWVEEKGEELVLLTNADSDLDSTHRSSHPQVAALPLQRRAGFLESSRSSEADPLYLQGFICMAPCAFQDATCHPRNGATDAVSLTSWTAGYLK